MLTRSYDFIRVNSHRNIQNFTIHYDGIIPSPKTPFIPDTQVSPSPATTSVSPLPIYQEITELSTSRRGSATRSVTAGNGGSVPNTPLSSSTHITFMTKFWHYYYIHIYKGQPKLFVTRKFPDYIMLTLMLKIFVPPRLLYALDLPLEVQSDRISKLMVYTPVPVCVWVYLQSHSIRQINYSRWDECMWSLG